MTANLKNKPAGPHVKRSAETEGLTLTVGDIKQFFYCPRLLYFLYLMPHLRPVTYKMEEGRHRQKEEQRLEKRRTLARFGFKEGDKIFDLRLFSTTLSLSGMLDMAVVTDTEVIPVDFKDGSMSRTTVPPLHHKYQLVSYGLLLEEAYGKPCHRGFIHGLEDGSTKEQPISQGSKAFALWKIQRIRRMITTESLPPPTRSWWRCRECEFKPVC